MDPFALHLDVMTAHLMGLADESPQGRAVQQITLDHTTLRMTAIGFTAGSELPDHENPGEATLQVLVGRVTLSWGARSLEVERGMIARIPDARHRVVALEPSVILLTAVSVH